MSCTLAVSLIYIKIYSRQMHRHTVYRPDSLSLAQPLPRIQPAAGSPGSGIREPRLDRSSPAVSFETAKCEPSNFVSTFKIELPNLDPLHFHINFRTGLSISTKKKKSSWNFERDFIEFVDEFSFASLTILGLPVPMNVF